MTTSPAALAEPAAPRSGGRRWRALATRMASVVLIFAAAAGVIVVLTVNASARAVNPEIAAAQPAAPVVVDEPAPTASQQPAAAVHMSGPRNPPDPSWLGRVAAATGIPSRALAGYASAAIAVAKEQPGCGLSWNTLAAIGAVESSHGEHQDGQLLDSGLPSSPIRGPALNGSGLGMIRDSDKGAWDGDATWDRAIGPMQFIPATWRRWGADGNGDGKADPNQIDDAALAAGRYLCASGSLRSPSGWRAAIYSYNHSDAYVDKVAGVANSYAAVSGG
ncbi:lytic transglycosylase domain-containing protein [Propionicimonas paludicola]|uniref:lytic transglycosylase domain-containing protein n=1 Tax=Propionicimonas paludicola TaxID=185243 RepID=UPI000BF37BF2|nr:lytic transglycosylase domain-containing protein [Propionicimonas paludicola]